MDNVEKIPVYGHKIHQIATWLWIFRYYFNLGFVAIPWTIYYVIMMGFNIYVNIAWNKWWAGGNIFLVANSAYHVLMGLHSIFLVYEFEAYLRWTRVIRVLG